MKVLEDFVFSNKRSDSLETTSLDLKLYTVFLLMNQYNQIIRNLSLKCV